MEMPKNIAEFLSGLEAFDSFVKQSDAEINSAVDRALAHYYQTINNLGSVTGVVLGRLPPHTEYGGKLNIWNILQLDANTQPQNLAKLFQLGLELEYDLGTLMDTRVSNVGPEKVQHIIHKSLQAGFETYMIDFEIESHRR